MIELARYWDEYIQDIIVDRDRAVDNELAELQQIWLEQFSTYNNGKNSLSKLSLDGSGKKSILKSPSNFNMRLKPQS